MQRNPQPLLNSSTSAINRALKAARETRRLELGSGVLASTPEMFRDLFPGRAALIVADNKTLGIAGNTVLQALREANVTCRQPLVFTDRNLYAEHSYVIQIEKALAGHDAIPVAVGSGTLNDLVKLAAHRHRRSYLAVATAASMDGYAAFGASITFKGSKQTFACPAPAGIIADLDILAAAPPEMTAAGYADLLAKITAGADWILADALGEEPIATEAWDIVQSGLRDLVADPAGVRRGELDCIRKLTGGLLLGGFAMQSAQSSRPASGAEHQFSHLWDMQHHTCNGQAPSHGFKVGIGTLAVAALYEHLLQLPLEKLDVTACCAQWPAAESVPATIRQLLGSGDLAEKAIEETSAKQIDAKRLRSQLEQIRRLWPDLKVRLTKQLLPFSDLQQKLADAGAPVEPEQIGISRARLRDSFLQAFYIRRRFTVLDFAARTRVLASSLDRLFGTKGRWPIPNLKSSALLSVT